MRVLVIDDTRQGLSFQAVGELIRTLFPKFADREQVEAEREEIFHRLHGCGLVIFIAPRGRLNPVLEQVLKNFDEGWVFIVAPEITAELLALTRRERVQVFINGDLPFFEFRYLRTHINEIRLDG